jgi:tetratricopeptide (TPR) repeat protein
VLADDLLARFPDLVERHDVELVAIAPELAGRITCRRATLMATAAAEERTRYYPAAYTARLAHGCADLLIEYVSRLGGGHVLVVHNADAVEATDAELLSILLRRLDPGLLRLVICSSSEPTGQLAEALQKYTAEVPGPAVTLAEAADLSEEEHDRRAEELERRGEFSLRLGAIPFHRERGTDPSGAGADALELALGHCVMQGFYHAVIDLGHRVLALLDWETDPDRCWLATVKMCTALAALNRPGEAEDLYDAACRSSTAPSVHLHAAYGRAMLYTRFYGESRDHQRAKAWINTAIAIAGLGSEQQRRAYNITFQENGRALIEMHLGNLHESLRLVEAGLARMNEEVDAARFTPHRSVLTYNRAQLLAKIGTPEDAVRAYDAVIDMDPNHSEYYVERAALYRKMGRTYDAYRDYDTAIALSPPYPQVHFNRGDLAMEQGAIEDAITDFGRAIELDDTLVDGFLNRASCHLELGRVNEAARDVDAGLALDAGQPHLHCLRGMVEQRRGNADTAREAFHTALELDTKLVAAWCNLGVLAFDNDDPTTAIGCLDRAIELDDSATMRANRGIAHQHVGQFLLAVTDFDAALRDADPSESDELRSRRDRCLALAGS